MSFLDAILGRKPVGETMSRKEVLLRLERDLKEDLSSKFGVEFSSEVREDVSHRRFYGRQKVMVADLSKMTEARCFELFREVREELVSRLDTLEDIGALEFALSVKESDSLLSRLLRTEVVATVWVYEPAE